MTKIFTIALFACAMSSAAIAAQQKDKDKSGSYTQPVDQPVVMPSTQRPEEWKFQKEKEAEANKAVEDKQAAKKKTAEDKKAAAAARKQTEADRKLANKLAREEAEKKLADDRRAAAEQKKATEQQRATDARAEREAAAVKRAEEQKAADERRTLERRAEAEKAAADVAAKEAAQKAAAQQKSAAAKQGSHRRAAARRRSRPLSPSKPAAAPASSSPAAPAPAASASTASQKPADAKAASAQKATAEAKPAEAEKPGVDPMRPRPSSAPVSSRTSGACRARSRAQRKALAALAIRRRPRRTSGRGRGSRRRPRRPAAPRPVSRSRPPRRRRSRRSRGAAGRSRVHQPQRRLAVLVVRSARYAQFRSPIAGDREQRTLAADYSVKSGMSLDLGGGYRVWRALAAGVSVTRFKNSGDVPVNGSVPHPFFFNRARPVTGVAPGVRQEMAVHVDAMWVVPIRPKMTLAVFGGPSFYSVKQTAVTDFDYNQSYPYDDVTLTRVIATDESSSVTGVNFGADVGYYFTESIGVGGLIRFGRASVDTSIGSLDVGGPEFGVGLRIRIPQARPRPR